MKKLKDNHFGGSWTEQKVIILEKYAKAYLQIMKGKPWKVLYFDGFAGTGDIVIEGDIEDNIIKGASKRIVSINNPIPFDICYFVEKDSIKASKLKSALHFIRKENVHVVSDDCNEKIKKMAEFLQNNNYKALVFIDPFGINLDWASIEILRGLGVDLWILAPTGLGVNRMLENKANLPESWWLRLERFFGVNRKLILNTMYKEYVDPDLFGGITKRTIKVTKATSKIFEMYQGRMKTVFNYTSDPYIIINRNNSVMYHFFLASDNQTAINIANDIVRPYNDLLDYR
ncbi:hypothetical protein ADIARSV_3195 [Arcticibacter svalbardensis MN12-7]|uniref:Three-Cys-motif partner protein TcmP n=1 Tax=Arcticibacter svalbardensis MN12-7 TaxID=1150600 RepID=R9GPI0_9SPHI|nr:three-Cys-motif partner protein TcmP [Arcticibacter svalbardensis]EOR93611.1 hypothetical protein ADIARSV_3195 [Arcticibacter svalbardensis MN12-7]